MRELVDVERLLAALGVPYEDRGGDEMWACCPLPDHDEKTPSWSINAGDAELNGTFHCFGCGASGSAADLVVSVVGLSGFAAAKRWMGERGLLDDGVVVPQMEVSVAKRAGGGFSLPDGMCGGPLDEWVTPARRYMQQPDRAVTPAQVERWGLKYAVDGRLAGRVVFPIVDYSGTLLSYTARSFDGREPKYLTPNKKKEQPREGGVFGELHWPDPLWRRRFTVHVTEGAFNALAVERAGAEYIAAMGGSSPDRSQMAKIGTFGRVVLVTDPDGAGDRVAARLLTAYVRWSEVERVELPPGKDPASLSEQELRRLLWARPDQARSD